MYKFKFNLLNLTKNLIFKELNYFQNGDWGLGPIPNPQSPIPNPQSPLKVFKKIIFKMKNNYNKNSMK